MITRLLHFPPTTTCTNKNSSAIATNSQATNSSIRKTELVIVTFSRHRKVTRWGRCGERGDSLQTQREMATVANAALTNRNQRKHHALTALFNSMTHRHTDTHTQKKVQEKGKRIRFSRPCDTISDAALMPKVKCRKSRCYFDATRSSNPSQPLSLSLIHI